MTTETKFTVGEYTMRNGRNARVFIVNKDGTLVGARQLTDGSWTAEKWFGGGRACGVGTYPTDLMPPLREWWICKITPGRYFTLTEKPSPHSEWDEIIHVREVRDDQA